MALIKRLTKEEKLIRKERERIHKDMVRREESYRKEDKIAPEGSFVSLQHINKIYDNHVQAVYDFNLEIKPQEFIVFVGPSGCGKSTTLRMIGGLEEITYGDLYINGEYSNDLEPKERNIAMVFQNYALYPHLNVYDNMAFGLKMRHTPKVEIDKLVKEAANILDLNDYLDRKPNALSGGQMQRVALGRAIVRKSRLFLMDEPLSNLDAKLRVQMRAEIVRLHKELKTTTIYVTHDQTEAMTMADRIVVMNKGYVQQIGTPREIYDKPANMFVAAFIGSPAMNIFSTKYEHGVIHIGDDYSFKLDDEFIAKHDDFYQNEVKNLNKEINELNDELAKGKEIKECKANKQPYDKKSKYNDENYLGFVEMKIKEKQALLEKYNLIIKEDVHEIKLGIRPEDILRPEDTTSKIKLGKTFSTKVELSELLGREYYIHFSLGGVRMVNKVTDTNAINIGDEIVLGFNTPNIHLFDLESTKLIF